MSPSRGNTIEGLYLSFGSAVLGTLADFSMKRVGSWLVLDRVIDAVKAKVVFLPKSAFLVPTGRLKSHPG